MKTVNMVEIEETMVSKLEAFTIVEVQKHIHEGQKVTAEYCSNIIKQSNQIAGYALYMAKEVVFYEDTHGYSKFLVENGVSVKSAESKIRFFKNTIAAKDIGLLPTVEAQYKELRGNNIQERVNNYAKVKGMLHEKVPPSHDIKLVNKTLSRGLGDKELESEFIEKMKSQPVCVKNTFNANSKQSGLGAIINAIDDGRTTPEIMSVIIGNETHSPKSKKVTSKIIWDSMTDSEQYRRIMFLEQKLEELTKIDFSMKDN